MGVTGGKAAVLAAVAMLLLPAVADAKRGSIYDVKKASGFERVTFSGDADANCAQFSVCGYSGIVTYRMGGTPKGTIALTKSRSGKVKASARYKLSGATKTAVTPPSGAQCTDDIAHNTDVFSLTSSGSRFQSLLLEYHRGATVDYLKTACAGPTEADVRAAGAMPEGLFAAKDFFRGKRPRFALSGATSFKQAGFNATIEWSMNFGVKQRACSPKCQLPAGTP